MKKTNTTKSVRKETVKANVNTEAEVKETANEAKSITIKDPDAKATRAQLQLIGHAVKQGKIERFSEDAWENLTKGQAAEIISKNFADGIPASDAQKQKVSELVRNGWIKGMKAESFKNLSSDFAKTLIFKGQQNEAAGTKVEGWEERTPLAKDAPMTDRQKERITQLVKDGFLNRFNNKFFKSMTHEIASKFIGLGKSRQANGEKAPIYVRPEAAAVAAA